MGQSLNKSGVKTTEFWVTIINNIVGILVVLGYVTPQQADDVTKAVVSIIGGVVIVSSTAVYVWGRIKLKTAASNTGNPDLSVLEEKADFMFGQRSGSGKYIPVDEK